MNVQLVTKTIGVGKYEGLTSEEIVSAIARHGVIKEDNGRLVRYLMDNNHWSPLDMINFAFEIETSRAMGRHILRHDLRPQEHSQRYSDKIVFEPIELRKEHEVNRQSSTEVMDFSDMHPWRDERIFYMHTDDHPMSPIEAVEAYLKIGEDLYNHLIKIKVAKECARFILPECTQTIMTFNGTLRNWLSFLNVRMHYDAQKEVRLVAERIGEALEVEMPNVFSRINWKTGLFM
jgi:thymidylate synthase (FAD)